jgi:hypothetical protein
VADTLESAVQYRSVGCVPVVAKTKDLFVESIKIVFCPIGTFDLELWAKNLSDPTDLRTICSAFEHFFLPAALCSINDDALVIWNPVFQKRAGVSEKELARGATEIISPS